MILLKSFITATAALAGYVVLVGLAFWLTAEWHARKEGVGVISGPGWPLLVGALFVFVAAFAWGSRRFSK